MIEIISYPFINEINNPIFLEYIKKQLLELPKIWKRSLDNNSTIEGLEGIVLRGIRSGGKSSFTNKITKYGYFSENIDISILLRNTLIFYNMLNKISYKILSSELNYKFLSKYICVYRFVRKDNHSNESLIQPIPMSCSWSFKIAKEWMGNQKGYIYEIILKQNNLFLNLSYPGKKINKKYCLYNQSQLEVTLPPCILKYKSKFKSKIHEVWIYKYIFQELNEIEIKKSFEWVKKNGIILKQENPFMF